MLTVGFKSPIIRKSSDVSKYITRKRNRVIMEEMAEIFMQWKYLSWRPLVGSIEIKIAFPSETQHIYWWNKLGHRHPLHSSFHHLSYYTW
jgi:hypothetical protein